MNSNNILIYVFTATVLFCVLTTPYMYKLTGKKTSKYNWVTSSPDGIAYASGIALHSVIFFLLLLSLTIDNWIIGIILSASVIGGILAL